MLDVYNRLIGQCRTLNQVNQLHIALGNSMTPGEVVYLKDTVFVPGEHPEPALHPERKFTMEELRDNARDWARRLFRDVASARKVTPEPFLRRDLHKSATLFTDGAPPTDKILLLALPGANHQMMTSVPTFLQNLDAGRVDMVIIRDGTRTRYLAGIEGLADSIEAFGDLLPEWLGFARYRRVAGIGVSAGSLPVLLAGLRAGIDDLLLVGPTGPYDPRWEGRPHDRASDVLKKAAADGRERRITVAYGAQCEEDRVYAGEIKSLINVTAVEISDPYQSVGHSALQPLALRGELGSFLVRHLHLDQ